MNIYFKLEDITYEPIEFKSKTDAISGLSNMVFDIFNNLRTKESTILCGVKEKDGYITKISIPIEKHPACVKDGKMSMIDYVKNKVSGIVYPTYSKKDTP